MGPAERRRLSGNAAEDDVTESHTFPDEKSARRKTVVRPEPASDEGDDEDGSATGDDESGSDEDAEDDVAEAQRQVEADRKAHKRPRRRAVSPSRFGEALQSLLNTNAPSEQPLSLKPSVARRRKDDRLEGKAKKVLDEESRVKKEQNHVSDLIGGWGGESERALRKVAQRGVVKLFNAIQQSHQAAAAAQEDLKATRGSGKPTLPAPDIDTKRKKKGGNEKTKEVGNEASIGHDDFLSLIRSGGIVSKI